jgi:carbamoyl-phosphate synthase large subunit
VVTKIPRFAFEKFPAADPKLTTQMKSVGEVMAIGRTFQESFQKALRGLETGIDGLATTRPHATATRSSTRSAAPGPERILFLGDAFRIGHVAGRGPRRDRHRPVVPGADRAARPTEQALAGRTVDSLSVDDCASLKRKGFSDRRLATLLGTHQHEVRERRWALGVRPVYKRVDTCAAEFATQTAYMYSTYDEECEAEPSTRKKIMVLGGGPNRIGQGIEFDYCCVHAALAMREDGYETIMVNCNPETVSTDYDTSDRLYFEPVTLEDVLEIVDKEKPLGVIVQYGGQTPLKLALDLERAGVPIIGTTPDSIDIAEDRERFQKLLQRAGPEAAAEPHRENRRAGAGAGARDRLPAGGAPELRAGRPRDGDRARRQGPGALHARGGAGQREVARAAGPLPRRRDRGRRRLHQRRHDVVIGGIMEHVEAAGIHSGDSACSLPPYTLPAEPAGRDAPPVGRDGQGTQGRGPDERAVRDPGRRDAAVVYVLEVNPRASRTVPYVSKATGQQLAKIAARCMAGQRLKDQITANGRAPSEVVPPYFSIKEAVFPFNKFPGVDPILGPEMRSTGEVMGVGRTFGEAMLKSQLGAGSRLPAKGTVVLTVKNGDKARAVAVARDLVALGFTVVATKGTAAAIGAAGIPVKTVNKVKDGRPHIVDMVKAGEIQLVFTTVDETRTAIADSRAIRTAALANRITYYTTMAGAEAATEALKHQEDLTVFSLQELHAELA